MRQIMVQYTVRPECADDNVRLIREVFESLEREAPADLTYMSYRLEDGVSFVHIAAMRDVQSNPLRALPAFQAFVAGVRERCATPPVTTTLETIGSYAQLGASSLPLTLP